MKKMHTRILSLLLALALAAVTFSACGDKDKKDEVVEDDTPKGQVIIGTSTEANGDWAYSAFTSNPNATDNDVMYLTDDVNTVATNMAGDYVLNNTVVEKYERTEDADGNATYTFEIKKGMKFNNGTDIKAENFLAWRLFTLSPAGKEMGTVTAEYNMIAGGAAYREGTATFISGLRLLDEYKFSVTVLKTGTDGNAYLPYFYDLGYAAARAVNLDYWFGEGWSVKDDGEGAYLSNANRAPTRLLSKSTRTTPATSRARSLTLRRLSSSRLRMIPLSTPSAPAASRFTPASLTAIRSTLLSTSSTARQSTALTASMTAPVSVTSSLPATSVLLSSRSSVRLLPTSSTAQSSPRHSARAGAALSTVLTAPLSPCTMIPRSSSLPS